MRTALLVPFRFLATTWHFAWTILVYSARSANIEYSLGSTNENHGSRAYRDAEFT
jgi:hypothetical protein